MLSPFTFQMGLIIYVGLLLLTPKVPSLPFDPQDNAFLSWVHSYTAFHSLISGSAEHSPLHQLKVSHGGFLHFKEKTFFNSVNIFTNNCRELVWGPPPVAKVMRKEARHTQRWDGASGVPLEILEHLPPKPESAYFTTLCSHLHLWLYRGLSPTTSFGEGS